ncbi:MAG: hypothetical protein ABSH44_06240 [Bryobacteraceae bacterium]
MAREARWGRRVALVLFLLAATVCAQTHALAFEHQHHSSEHCCLLCHIGPLPLLPSSVSAAVVAPVLSTVWVASSDSVETPREALLSAASCRAPPA